MNPQVQLQDMQEVIPGLFVGNAQAAENLEFLQNAGITHVLQATNFMTPSFPEKFEYKIVDIEDMAECNIIKHFPETNQYIQDCLDQGGKVLVHCVAGVSRSVTFVCAYLMKTFNLEPLEALKKIKAVRFMANPNHGFFDQLVLYKEIDYDVDVKNAAYRRFLMASDAEQMGMMRYVEEMTLGADPEKVKSSVGTPKVKQLRCKRCRRNLVSNEHIIEHVPGKGQTAFSYHKRDSELHISQAIGADPTSINHSTCSSYFIEPMEWISGLDSGALEGKILCPKCDGKLGNYCWAGAQCSCGAWVTPSFTIHRNRVDELTR
ncbi:dual specificity protein phosphatase 12 [Basidiobolus meristosporus CBS 931.73]|uniref:Dual specificity protein phosphatase 12 n=1 Tax=Basidiobolus meristosporus CBS 931.73 TaxID=1314790 RepID=A0A1Y1Y792_9FUNG|nr:dual specificity protein phosphatase 12 [Basidiobolus meristosporus CBS 931.73]|eukprot:ORX93882.1 dual specificity protein phosphatase 12 [Basidiobolus meristosporus CBS 931.73]